MLAVVTGASGHLGVNLVNSLLARQWQVRTLVHLSHKTLQGIDAEVVFGNVLDENSLEKAFEGADIVFNLAAKVSVVEWNRSLVEEINIKGPRNVVEACKKNNVKRLVHVSSFHACEQFPHTEPLDESRQLVEKYKGIPYDYSKACGEMVVREAIAEGMDAVVVSPTGVIGPYDYQPSHFGAILMALGSGKMNTIVDAGLDWVDARDVAEGMIRAAEIDKPSGKYMLSGHWMSLKEIAAQISEITGNGKPLITAPMWLAKLAAPFAQTYDRLSGKRALFTSISMKALGSNCDVSHTKAESELDYDPRPLEETIKDTLAWFKYNGYLKYNNKQK